MAQDVFVWIEQRSGVVDTIGLEALAAARTISESLEGNLVAIVLGNNVEQLAKQVIQYGADNVFIPNDATLQNFRLEPYAAVVSQLAQTCGPTAILMGASDAGLELSVM